MIIAHTVKGKGVSIFEGQKKYHGTTPNPEEYQQALEGVGGLITLRARWRLGVMCAGVHGIDCAY